MTKLGFEPGFFAYQVTVLTTPQHICELLCFLSFNSINATVARYINDTISAIGLWASKHKSSIQRQPQRENSRAWQKNQQSGKERSTRRHARWIPVFVSNQNAGREHVVWCERAYIHEQSLPYVWYVCMYIHARGLMLGAALINMHSRRNIYRRRLLLEARALCDAPAEVPADPTACPRS